jgi:hypothetical protein
LALGDAAFFKPVQNDRIPQFLWELFGPNVEGLHRLLRKFDGDLSSHEMKLRHDDGSVK